MKYKNRNSGPVIYSLVNIVNNKIYIGSAVDLYNRIALHKRNLVNKTHHSKKLQNAINKHSIENFDVQIIEYVALKEDLLKREQVWMDFFRPEYNICPIAGSRLGVKVSDETKRKISAVQKGRKISEQTRANRIKSLESIRGVPRTDEVKRKISIANSGKKRTVEQNEASSKARKGRKLPESARLKLIGKPSWNKGIKMSEKIRQNMSKAFTGRVLSEEHKEKLRAKVKPLSDAFKKASERFRVENGGFSAKAVINYENGIFYNSAKEALNAYGRDITLTSFGRKLRGEQKMDIPFSFATPESISSAKQKVVVEKQMPWCKIVINNENGIFYNSIKEAYFTYGKSITLTSFGRKIRGEQKMDIPFIYAND